MLMRFDPFRELDRDLDKVTQQVWGSRRVPVMPMDAYRRGDAFFVQFDLPDIEPDSVELTVEKNVLTVRAERRFQREEGDEILVTERPQGSFSRQLFLGEGLDTDHIDAHYEAGVLTVKLPVAEQAKPRRVEVKTGDSAKAIPAESHSA
jgi:HSP20 family protein